MGSELVAVPIFRSCTTFAPRCQLLRFVGNTPIIGRRTGTRLAFWTDGARAGNVVMTSAAGPPA